MKFDVEAITLGDLEELETHGVNLADLQALEDGGMPSASVLIGVGWLARRSEDPDYTIDQARRIPLGELMSLVDTIETPSSADLE